MLVRVANYLADAGQSRDFLRCSLRITASYNNLALGIFSMDAANSGACILIGGGGHGTGVEDHDLCRGRISCGIQSTIEKLALNCSPIRLGCPAAEVLYVKRAHNVIVREK